jgi:hypothetical protein
VTLIPAYGSNGWGGFDKGGGIYITGVTFGPIYGDKDFLEAKFQRHVEARRKGLLYNLSDHQEVGPATVTMSISLHWYDRYAIDNGKMDQLQAADAEIAEKVFADKRAEKEMWARVFEDAKAHAGGISDEKAYYDMSMAAMKLGGEYEKEFEKVPKPESLARFDSIGSSTSSSAGGSSDPNARVEIRSYDSTGNYTGSVMTSPFWASVISMTSASH